METMFQWLGMALVWVLFVLIAWGLFNWTIDGFRNLYDRMISAARFQERQNIGQEIACQSHWFSESKDAQTVLKVLGERLTKYPDHRYDAEGVREEWRRKLDEK